MESDIELKYLKELGEGNPKAFDILFTHYHPHVKKFLFGFIKDEELANDMAQDIFFKIWLKRDAIAKITSFKSYLFRMARNTIYDHYEHELIKQKYENKELEKSTSLYSELIEEEIYAKELYLLIELAIEKMPAQRKRIFTLSRKEGLTNEEIAQQLNINKRTVENHITLALRELRELLSIVFFFFI